VSTPKSNPAAAHAARYGVVKQCGSMVALAGDGGHRGDRRAGHFRAHGSAWNVSNWRDIASLQFEQDYWLYERRVERLARPILP